MGIGVGTAMLISGALATGGAIYTAQRQASEAKKQRQSLLASQTSQPSILPGVSQERKKAAQRRGFQSTLSAGTSNVNQSALSTLSPVLG